MSHVELRDDLLGTVIGGRYQVTRRLGRGGMGAVYEVAHTRMPRRFAIKCLRVELAGNEEWLARFQRETDVVAKIDHPGIVNVFDCEVLADGSPCLVMELLEGESLATRLARQPRQSWSSIARIGDEILSALTAAHAAGVIHRDLKPENIFMARDGAGGERAKLLDFGLSKVTGAVTLITSDARIMGTPAYMAPEQADSRHADIGVQTDAWACGAILYQMATGKHAFWTSSVPQTLYRICHGSAEPLSSHRSDAPEAFTRLIEDTLCRDPERRVREATVMRRRLREALADLAPGAFAELNEIDTGRDDDRASIGELSTDQEPVRLHTTLSASTGSTSSRRAVANGPRWARIALATAAVLVLAAVITVGTRWESSSPSASSPSASTPRSASAPPVVTVPRDRVAPSSVEHPPVTPASTSNEARPEPAKAIDDPPAETGAGRKRRQPKRARRDPSTREPVKSTATTPPQVVPPRGRVGNSVIDPVSLEDDE